MEIIPVNNHNLNIYLNLVQCYEAEFSAITKKLPDEQGKFDLDTEIGGHIKGYLLYVDGNPAGLTAIDIQKAPHFEVCEFYVLPYFRKQRWGTRFAHEVWQLHPGHWEIKQITGAEYATNFWRKVISAYPQLDYVEDSYQDEYWGRVTRQRFMVNQSTTLESV